MNVMSIAWKIAKEAVAKFGGNVKEYFAAALKMAWAQVKNVATNVVIELSEGSRKHKSWVAELTGVDAKFGFARKFVNGFEDSNVRGLFFKLIEGKVYDVNCAQKGRSYVTVQNGVVVELSNDEVKSVVA